MVKIVIPDELIMEESLPCVGAMKTGDYGWVQVWADSSREAFVYLNSPVRIAQGEFWPHLVTKIEGGYTARLLTQRVVRLTKDVSKDKSIARFEAVEF